MIWTKKNKEKKSKAIPTGAAQNIVYRFLKWLRRR